MKMTPGRLRAGATVGAFLTLGGVLGLLGTVFGMMRAFRTLGGAGIGDAEGLSNNVTKVSYLAPAGLILFTCGLALGVVCRVLLHQARRDERVRPPEETEDLREMPPPLPSTE